MKAYLLRLICAAFVCALADAISDAPGQKIRRMAAGLFLMLTVLSFPKHLDLPEFDFDRIQHDAVAAASAGKTQSEDAQADIITEAYTAYILTEAGTLGLSPEICVMLHDDLTPERVILSGDGALAARQALTEAVAEGLGLGEEDVIWKDLYQSSA